MSRWVSASNIASAPRVNVFCFPFAGGGASFYRAWMPRAPGILSLCPVQLPGREERFVERPFDRMPALVEAAAENLVPFLNKPYALFGHSMGALVSYELAHALRERGAPSPAHLFVSGSPAPHVAGTIPTIYDLPEESFLDGVRRYGGLPEDVLRSKELLDLLMPRLRADLAVTGTYVYKERPPLACPIHAFGGLDDDIVTPDAIEAWREHSVSEVRVELFPGGHFFISEFASRILSTVAADLTRKAFA